jgi:hypothetical protein
MSVLKRISELPLLASVLATALVPVEQEGVTYSVAAGSLGAGTVSTPNVVVDDDLAAEANTLAIEANIQALMALGHGEMRLPPGVTWVAEGSLLATVCIQLGATVANLTIRGSGEGISTLKLKGSGASHVINIDGASNIKIFDLTVDGNRDNNTTTNYHGIRTGNSGVDGLTIERVTAQNTRGYGFGLQGGNKKRVRLINVTAANTGADGCDWTNISDDSEDIVIVGYSARNWGLDGSLTVQAGLDLRGPCQVMGVWTSGGSSDGFHVRVREGEIADASLGGHFSHLQGIVCEGLGTGTQIGIYIAAHDVTVTGAQVSGCFLNYELAGERITITGATADGALDENFQVDAPALDARLVGCHSRTATGNAYRLRAPRTVMVGCSTNADIVGGVAVEATATDCTIECLTGVGLGGTTVGIDNAAVNLTVTGGNVQGFFRGVSTVAARTKIIGVTARNNTAQGILAAVGGDDCIISGCTVHQNGTINIQMRAARGRVIANSITSSVNTGLDITATATGTLVDNNTFNGNAGLALGDAGTGTVVGLNAGMATPYLTESVKRLAGTGTPEGVHAAPVGSTFNRTDGGVGSSFYVKETGTGNTGWAAK